MDNSKNITQSNQNLSFCKTFIQKYWFAFLILTELLFKYFLLQSIPLKAHVNNIHDHRMMVDIAENILKGSWLGDTYINRHLAKGCGYPLLTAVQNLLGLTLHQTAWILYSAGCLFMTFALRPIVKNRFLQFLIFTFLMLCPDYDMNLIDTYRFWVQGWQLLFIYSSVTAIFIRRNKLKSILLWSIPGAFGTFFYWHSFENSFWLILLYAAVAASIAVFSAADREKLSCCLKKCAAILSPLVLIAMSIHIISLANYHKYGFYGTTIVSSSNFPNLIKAIYSVKPATDKYALPIPVPQETMNRIFDASPTLQKYQSDLAEHMDPWTIHGRFPDDNESEGGWFYWSILRYFEGKSFAEQDDIYRSAANESMLVAMNNGLWKNGSNINTNILLLRKTAKNAALLKKYKFFSPENGKNIRILRTSDAGVYLQLHYEGKRLQPGSGRNRIFFK